MTNALANNYLIHTRQTRDNVAFIWSHVSGRPTNGTLYISDLFSSFCGKTNLQQICKYFCQPAVSWADITVFLWVFLLKRAACCFRKQGCWDRTGTIKVEGSNTKIINWKTLILWSSELRGDCWVPGDDSRFVTTSSPSHDTLLLEPWLI